MGPAMSRPPPRPAAYGLLVTTNIAARLAAAASGGEIVLSETTRGRLAEDVACEDLRLRELKNVDGAVRLFRVVEEAQRERTGEAQRERTGGERGPFRGPR